MKIEVTKEQYDFLKKAKNELLNQNNRCTRNPIYLIMNKKEELRPSCNYQYYKWINSEHEVVADTDEELFEVLTKTEIDKDDLKCYYKNDLDKNCSLKDAFLNDIEYLDEYEKEGIGDFYRYYYDIVDNIPESNTFSFFEKDAKDHLESNDYHYHDSAITYACSMWRSPMMEELRELLINLDIKD